MLNMIRNQLKSQGDATSDPKMSKIKKTDHTNCWQGFGTTRLLSHQMPYSHFVKVFGRETSIIIWTEQFHS